MKVQLVKIFLFMLIGKIILNLVFGFTNRLIFRYFGLPPLNLLTPIIFAQTAISGCILVFVLAMLIRWNIAPDKTTQALFVGFAGLVCSTVILPIINYYLGDYRASSLVDFGIYFRYAVFNIYTLWHFLCLGLGIWLYNQFNKHNLKRKNTFLNSNSETDNWN